ncbi:MAG: TetR/AcrR family transcriptional regulator [Bacillota bacterium]
MPRVRASWMDGQERRRLILEAALQVFSERSYAAATTNDVAQAAGVSQATVFKYFPAKRDLFVAALDHTTGLVLERWQEAAEGTASPLQRLRAIARAYARMAATEHASFRVRLRAVAESDDPVIAEAARRSYLAIVDFVRRELERARGAGELPADLDAAAAAWYFLSVGQGFNLNHFVGFNWDDATVDRVTEHLFRGLGLPPG